MIEHTWEIDAPSLAITLRWGDTVLHTTHLAPPRSFFLDGPSADCPLPGLATGSDRVPLVLAERGALYLVLLPSMDPDGVIAAPGHALRTVADLARPGMAAPSLDVPGAFLVELVPGMTADLAIDDVTLAVTLETKAGRAVAGHYHTSRRMVPFQIGSAALHLALIAFASLFVGPSIGEDGPSVEQLAYIQHVLQVVAEKEEAEAFPEIDGFEAPPGLRRDFRSSADERADLRRFRRLPLESWDYGYSRSGAAPAMPTPPRGGRDFFEEGVLGDDGFHAAIDPRADRFSIFALDVDAAAGARARADLQRGRLPASVRPEELLNSFDYRYPAPTAGAPSPFAVHLAAAPSPFAAGHHLLRVGVQARRSAGGKIDPEILAREVGIEVDFTPEVVLRYRLIGYEGREGRVERRRWYNGDAAVIRAGHSVTAVYDVVLATTASSPVTVRIHHLSLVGRFGSTESVFVMAPRSIAPSFEQAVPSLRLAAAVAGFAEGLRQRPRDGEPRFAEVTRVAESVARAGAGEPAQELAALVRTARSLDEARLPTARRGQIADASLMGF